MSKAFPCTECSVTFKNHQHLRRHYKKSHPSSQLPSLKRSDVPFTFSCKDCNKEFNYFSNLIRHIKNFHTTEKQVPKSPNLPLMSKDFKCEYCDAAYSRKNILKRHKRLKHVSSNKIVRELTTINCSLCSTYSTKAKTELFRHFERQHDMKIITEEYEFETKNDFLEWKSEVENKTVAKFVSGRSEASTKMGNTAFYNCHRSGYFISQSKGLRKPRKRGSCKINSICPARMKVIILENGNYVVKFTETHVGHGIGLDNFISTKDTDKFVAIENLPD